MMECMPPRSGIEFLDRCVEGERTAWRELHRIYFPTAYAFLRAMGLSATDAEDACQEVFLQIHRSLRQFEGRSDFRTWLYRLCVTQAARSRRRARVLSRLRWLVGEREEAEARTASLDWDEGQRLKRVQAGLETLSPKHRVVLVLREFEGLPVAEIAAIVGCPEATVWTRLHYARKQFESALGEGMG